MVILLMYVGTYLLKILYMFQEVLAKGKTPRATYFSNFDGSTSNPDFGYENLNNVFPDYDSISGNS